jgi:hypothetical protein
MEVWSGGSSLMAKLAGIVGNAQDFKVEVGFLEGSTAGWNGPRPKSAFKNMKRTDKPAKGLPGGVAAPYIAAIMEYGNEEMNLPPRPFFSQMIAKQSPTWGKLMAAALKANNYVSQDALQLVGLKIKEQLQDSLLNGTFEPLQQKTVDRKGFSQPLIDSHNLINAADFRVVYK